MTVDLSFLQEVEKVMQKYQDLQKQLEKQPGGGDSLQRLMDLKTRAQKLLDKANSSKRKVDGKDAARITEQSHAGKSMVKGNVSLSK